MSRLDYAFHQSRNQLWTDQTLLPSQNWYFQPIKFFDLGQNMRNQKWWDIRFRIPYNKYVNRAKWVDASLNNLQQRFKIINSQKGSSLQDENKKVNDIIQASRAGLGQVETSKQDNKNTKTKPETKTLDPTDWNSYLTVEEIEKRDQNTLHEISAVRQEAKENRETGPKLSESDIELTTMMLKMFKNNLADMSSFQLDERFGFPFFSGFHADGSNQASKQSVLFNYQEGQTGRYTCGSPSVGLTDASQVQNLYHTSNTGQRLSPGYSNLQNPLLGGRGEELQNFISKNEQELLNKMEGEFEQMEKFMASFFNGGFAEKDKKQLANNFSSSFSSTRTSYKSYFDKETNRDVQIEESIIEDDRGVRTIRKKNGVIIFDEFKPKK